MTDQLSTRTRWLALVILPDVLPAMICIGVGGGLAYHVAFVIGAVFSVAATVIGASFLRTRTAAVRAPAGEPALETA